jgi:hypothetical protein
LSPDELIKNVYQLFTFQFYLVSAVEVVEYIDLLLMLLHHKELLLVVVVEAVVVTHVQLSTNKCQVDYK